MGLLRRLSSNPGLYTSIQKAVAYVYVLFHLLLILRHFGYVVPSSDGHGFSDDFRIVINLVMLNIAIFGQYLVLRSVVASETIATQNQLFAAIAHDLRAYVRVCVCAHVRVRVRVRDFTS